eukprot:1260186-Rhodomonas_salina.3
MTSENAMSLFMFTSRSDSLMRTCKSECATEGSITAMQTRRQVSDQSRGALRRLSHCGTPNRAETESRKRRQPLLAPRPRSRMPAPRLPAHAHPFHQIAIRENVRMLHF